MGNLTVARIKTLTTPGTYVDGDGLMLVVAPGGSRSWKLRVRIKASGAISVWAHSK